MLRYRQQSFFGQFFAESPTQFISGNIVLILPLVFACLSAPFSTKYPISASGKLFFLDTLNVFMQVGGTRTVYGERCREFIEGGNGGYRQ